MWKRQTTELTVVTQQTTDVADVDRQTTDVTDVDRQTTELTVVTRRGNRIYRRDPADLRKNTRDTTDH